MAKKEVDNTVELADDSIIMFTDGTGKQVVYDAVHSKLIGGKKDVHLSPNENILLRALVTHTDQLLSIFALNAVLHPNDILPETRHDVLLIREAIRPAMSRLRGKLRKAGLASHLETVHSDGYIFNSPNSHR